MPCVPLRAQPSSPSSPSSNPYSGITSFRTSPMYVSTMNVLLNSEFLQRLGLSSGARHSCLISCYRDTSLPGSRPTIAECRVERITYDTDKGCTMDQLIISVFFLSGQCFHCLHIRSPHLKSYEFSKKKPNRLKSNGTIFFIYYKK